MECKVQYLVGWILCWRWKSGPLLLHMWLMVLYTWILCCESLITFGGKSTTVLLGVNFSGKMTVKGRQLFGPQSQSWGAKAKQTLQNKHNNKQNNKARETSRRTATNTHRTTNRTTSVHAIIYVKGHQQRKDNVHLDSLCVCVCVSLSLSTSLSL